MSSTSNGRPLSVPGTEPAGREPGWVGFGFERMVVWPTGTSMGPDTSCRLLDGEPGAMFSLLLAAAPATILVDGADSDWPWLGSICALETEPEGPPVLSPFRGLSGPTAPGTSLAPVALDALDMFPFCSDSALSGLYGESCCWLSAEVGSATTSLAPFFDFLDCC